MNKPTLKDIIKIERGCELVDWIILADERNELLVFENTVMNRWVLQFL
jgi:hypothetical protein